MESLDESNRTIYVGKIEFSTKYILLRAKRFKLSCNFTGNLDEKCKLEDLFSLFSTFGKEIILIGTKDK
jgi:hypothetical protein